MKGEIDKEYYCSLWKNPTRKCGLLHFAKKCVSGANVRKKCEYLRHKFPTPEQYKKEYGEEVPDKFPVAVQLEEHSGWLYLTYEKAKRGYYYYWNKDLKITSMVVCCTPFVLGGWQTEQDKINSRVVPAKE